MLLLIANFMFLGHRCDDAKGFRRYKIQSKGSLSSVIHIGRKDGMESLQRVLPLHTLKKMIDHSPHEVFVQLDELHVDGDEREWKETARWIKYEEDVEEGADRWGRPHVASLSFHSLLNLRRCLETGNICNIEFWQVLIEPIGGRMNMGPVYLV